MTNVAKRLAFCSLFVTLAFMISYLESLIPLDLGVPGIKMGLSNMAVLSVLYLFGARDAFAVSIAKILLTGLLFMSAATILYSFAGGLLSFAAMIIIKKIPQTGMIGVSVAGGVFHNIGQILVATMVVGNLSLLYYLPVLMVAGIAAGFVVGLLSKYLVARISTIAY